MLTKAKKIKTCPWFLFTLSIFLSLSFSSVSISFFHFSSLPSHRLMCLTSQWARKSINCYSKQRAIMGALVQKLRSFQNHEAAGVRDTGALCVRRHTTLPQTHWRGRGGGVWQDLKRSHVCGMAALGMGQCHGSAQMASVQATAPWQRPNQQMTWWSSLPWHPDKSCSEEIAHKTLSFILRKIVCPLTFDWKVVLAYSGEFFFLFV